MTLMKNKKALGALTLALAMAASLSVSAFAQNTSVIPMIELVPSTVVSPAAKEQHIAKSSRIDASEITKSIPAAMLTEAQARDKTIDENMTTSIQTRTDEKTGKLEVSEDGGKTWSEYDGRAFKMTPAKIGQRP